MGNNLSYKPFAGFMVLVAFALLSCEKESGNGAVSVPDTVETENAVTTAMTATITGKLNGMSVSEFSDGIKGVLYMPSSDKSETVFQSWKDGDDNPGCSVFKQGKYKTDGTVTAVLENLTPDTEYDYCLFFRSGDRKRREISSIQKMKTAPFNPELVTNQVSEKRYFDAVLSGTLTISSNDAASCKYGFVYSDNEGVDASSGTTVNINQAYSPEFSSAISNLTPAKDYYYRTFVSYSNNGTDIYAYGPEVKFTTKSLDEMAVDMGLSVKWANCDLGDQDIEIGRISIGYFWGHLYSIKGRDIYHKTDKTDYQYYQSSTGTFMDIGSEISGTKYDAAKAILGGKWRMPTKQEAEELTGCRISKEIEQDGGRVAFVVTGPNGNSITINDTRAMWTGTACDDNEHAWAFMWMFYNSFQLTDFYIRSCEMAIRPVCDY